jgi:hypothetical protein
MSSQGNGKHQRPYSVEMSKETKARLVQLHQEALQKGTGQRLLDACRRIVERLKQDPLEFGEPLYRLPALHLLVCHAVVDFVVVIFAVHEERPLVFIRRFEVLD